MTKLTIGETSLNKEISKEDEMLLAYIHKNAVKKSISESEDYSWVLESDKSWNIFYHLCDIRKSILSWYNFSANASVLELNGEFGALTGLFCDRCEMVTVIEPVIYRAKAIAERYCKRNNLEILSGQMVEFKSYGTYDYVIMIGSFEQILDYNKFFELIKGWLKPNGKFLFASENRFGIKYFCGATGLQVTKPYAGISGYHKGTKGHLFSRQELDDLLENVGAQNHKFYYPLPDYQLTQMIYSDEYLPKKGIGERLIPYYLRSDVLLARETELYDELILNNVFPFFSNSFLVEAGFDEQAKEIQCNVNYATITTDRGALYATATCIHDFGIVTKKAIYLEGSKGIRNIYNNIKELQSHGIHVVDHRMEDNYIIMPFVDADLCSNVLRKLVYDCDGRQKIITLFQKLYQNILQSSQSVETSQNIFMDKEIEIDDWGVILSKAYVEMIPLNCFYMNGELYYFDQEFTLANCPANYVLYRALRYTYLFIREMEELIPLREMQLLFQLVNTWDVYEQKEEEFLSKVRNHKTYGNYYAWTITDKMRMYKNEYILMGCSYEQLLAKEVMDSFRNKKGIGMKKYRIGYVAGVFDLFHIGHLNLLRKAKESCNYLVVGVLKDDLVIHFKKNAPFIPFEERLEIVENIKYVDEVIPVTFDNISKMDSWKMVHFDCQFSGSDYENAPDWLEDKRKLQEVGSTIEFLPYTQTTCSTKIKQLINQRLQ